MMRRTWWIAVVWPAVSCGTPPEPAPPKPAPTAATATAPAPPPTAPPTTAPTTAATVAATSSPGGFDPCAGSPPVPREFLGALKHARCEQDMFLTMASVADQLGVQCKHCHVPHPTDPKKEIYPPMTPKKEIANWMSQHLMASIKPKDGSPMRCKSCHTDDAGKPIAKILGNPRDPDKAQEWMTRVMTNKFVTLSGEKLKCKHCHVDNFTMKGWTAKVIMKTEQIPKHETGGGIVAKK